MWISCRYRFDKRRQNPNPEAAARKNKSISAPAAQVRHCRDFTGNFKPGQKSNRALSGRRHLIHIFIQCRRFASRGCAQVRAGRLIGQSYCPSWKFGAIIHSADTLPSPRPTRRQLWKTRWRKIPAKIRLHMKSTARRPDAKADDSMPPADPENPVFDLLSPFLSTG